MWGGGGGAASAWLPGAFAAQHRPAVASTHIQLHSKIICIICGGREGWWKLLGSSQGGSHPSWKPHHTHRSKCFKAARAALPVTNGGPDLVLGTPLAKRFATCACTVDI